jgi:hypothetical protein
MMASASSDSPTGSDADSQPAKPGGHSGVRRGLIIGALVVGVGMMLAPVAFQMFTRAPSGASMINDFRPYMSVEQIELFQGYMEEIGDAVTETEDVLIADLSAAGSVDEATFATDYVLVASFLDQWPAIDEDMSDMLATMDTNRGNYAAVDALPSFDLFPWFFVIPGLLVAITATVVLVRDRKGHSVNIGRWIIVGLGVAILLAPVAFQMFSRAPDGGDMINDFRSMMTREQVEDVQGYFITLGTGEGQLRTALVPLADDPDSYVAITRFNDDWPTITGDFAPMIGTMSDNVDNFADVDALPPFPLFPWFFVIPGALIAGFGFFAGRGDHSSTESPETRSSS